MQYFCMLTMDWSGAQIAAADAKRKTQNDDHDARGAVAKCHDLACDVALVLDGCDHDG